mmetsp:Transcript_40172/g.79175  ORF Transcript_40172/g.79175 Transcript_40172/m.79175 type:complete len:107 (-) Transcript_40172:2245-2565(-)
MNALKQVELKLWRRFGLVLPPLPVFSTTHKQGLSVHTSSPTLLSAPNAVPTEPTQPAYFLFKQIKGKNHPLRRRQTRRTVRQREKKGEDHHHSIQEHHHQPERKLT